MLVLQMHRWKKVLFLLVPSSNQLSNQKVIIQQDSITLGFGSHSHSCRSDISGASICWEANGEDVELAVRCIISFQASGTFLQLYNPCWAHV